MRRDIIRAERPHRSPLCTALVLALMVYPPAWAAGAQSAPALDARTGIDIPAGDLAGALDRLSTQTGFAFMYQPEVVAGKQTKALSAHLTWQEALDRLLEGSSLEYRQVNATTVVIRRPEGSGKPGARPVVVPSSNSPTTSEKAPVMDMKAMTVTGTRIRGAQSSSPLVMITQEDMRLSGHGNLGEVIRALPQNFSGGQNPGVQPGAGGGIANQNLTGGSSLNLRGLGPDATLTLLNGARLPYDGFTQATDVAVIPVAAIDRMEVLLDGASAVYGSDAVGGVANIVLKRDFDGAEVSVRGGGATGGGNRQTQVSAIVGNTWSTGGFLLAGETVSGSAVWADQRGYLGYISRPDLLAIYPKTLQRGTLLSGHQELGSATELTVDAFYTRRSMRSSGLYGSLVAIDKPETEIYGISPSIRVGLPGEWTMRIDGFVGADETRTDGHIRLISTGAEAALSRLKYRNVVRSAGMEFEGGVFALPGGEARASLGGGARKTTFEQTDLVTGKNPMGGSNKSYYAYSEVNLPVVGEQQGLTLARGVSLNAALRYERYDDFGDITTPKIGVLWNVVPSLDFRASWGRSFKAPTALQRFQPMTVQLRTAASLGVPNAPGGATVLTTSGGNPDLGPERANIFTAGFMFRPQALPGASVELNWFDVDYTQRVVSPFQVTYAQLGQALNDPTYANFVVRDPGLDEQERVIRNSLTFQNLADIPYDPRNVVGLFRTQFFNASSQVVRGVDVDARYSFTGWGAGLWSFNAAGSWIAKNKRRLVDGTPEIEAVGVVAFPPRFKGQFGANWSRSNFTIGTIVNHLGGVRTVGRAAEFHGDSMTTVDFVLDYAAGSASLGGLGFNLSIVNALNQRPPFTPPNQPYYVNYDSTNYSALGRVVNVTVTKHF